MWFDEHVGTAVHIFLLNPDCIHICFGLAEKFLQFFLGERVQLLKSDDSNITYFIRLNKILDVVDIFSRADDEITGALDEFRVGVVKNTLEVGGFREILKL